MGKTGAVLLVVAVFVLGGAGSCAGALVINEVAWAGTAAGSADEWIELYNLSPAAIDLAGWTIVFGDLTIDLGSAVDAVIEPGGYFLLERSDDETVSDITADLIYRGALSNEGMLLRLLDQTGATVDTANAGLETGWAAGSTGGEDLPYATMERIDPAKEDSPANWRSNDGTIVIGRDASGGPLNGTPRAKNSATIILETVPVVTILAPKVEGQVIDGLFIVSWEVTDPDGCPKRLHVDLFLSIDGGITWEPLITGIVGPAYAWNTTALPDGDGYRLRATVTDRDSNIGEGISPIFTLLNANQRE